MKNIFFLIGLFAMPIISYANYEIRKPLEIQNGGHLEKGSIEFSKNNNTPQIEYSVNCLGIIGEGASHWRGAPGSPSGNLYWHGVLLAKSIPVGQDYINPEGGIYKRGNFIVNQGAFDWYELCEYVEKK